MGFEDLPPCCCGVVIFSHTSSFHSQSLHLLSYWCPHSSFRYLMRSFNTFHLVCPKESYHLTLFSSMNTTNRPTLSGMAVSSAVLKTTGEHQIFCCTTQMPNPAFDIDTTLLNSENRQAHCWRWNLCKEAAKLTWKGTETANYVGDDHPPHGARMQNGKKNLWNFTHQCCSARCSGATKSSRSLSWLMESRLTQWSRKQHAKRRKMGGLVLDDREAVVERSAVPRAQN